MKIIRHIIASVFLATMLLFLSGGTFHLHYCLSSQKYAFDFHYSSEKNCENHSCSCVSSNFEKSVSMNDHSCCKPALEESNPGSCCLDFLASSNPDKEYNYIAVNFNLSPVETMLLNLPEPAIFDVLSYTSYNFYKYRDHSPPETITTKVLLI